MNTFKVTTIRDVIRQTPERWKDVYDTQAYRGLTNWQGRLFSDVQYQLFKLDVETCSKEDVNAIIGNESWTRLTCDHCAEEVESVVTVGQVPDYESATASICQDCARKALEVFDL